MESDRLELIETMSSVARINEETKLSAEVMLTQDIAVKRTISE
jgi:hypothetical protein